MKTSDKAASSALAEELRSYVSALTAIKVKLPADAPTHGEIASCVKTASTYLDDVSNMTTTETSTVATWCLSLQNRCLPFLQPNAA
jgi:hypothetical protein